MKIHSSRSSSAVFTIVLGVTFAVLSIIIGYATISGKGFELRSRASYSGTPLLTWNIKTSQSGWTARDFGKVENVKEALYLTISNKWKELKDEEFCSGSKKYGDYKCVTKQVTRQFDPSIAKSGLSLLLRLPYNRFQMRMSVMPGRSLTATPVISGTPQPARQVGIANVAFRLSGKTTFETPLMAKFAMDGTQSDVVVDIPKSYLLKKIAEIRVSFQNIRTKAGTRIAITEAGVYGYTTDPKLPGSEESSESGCQYKQVECFMAPCDPILVCPSDTPAADTQ